MATAPFHHQVAVVEVQGVGVAQRRGVVGGTEEAGVADEAALDDGVVAGQAEDGGGAREHRVLAGGRRPAAMRVRRVGCDGVERRAEDQEANGDAHHPASGGAYQIGEVQARSWIVRG